MEVGVGGMRRVHVFWAWERELGSELGGARGVGFSGGAGGAGCCFGGGCWGGGGPGGGGWGGEAGWGLWLLDATNGRCFGGPCADGFEVRDCVTGGVLAGGFLGGVERGEGAERGGVTVNADETGKAGSGSVFVVDWLWRACCTLEL